MKNKKGRLLGSVLLILGIILFIVAIIRLTKGNYAANSMVLSGFMLMLGLFFLFAGLMILIFSLRVPLTKKMIKTQTNILEENKEDLEELTKLNANIQNPYFKQKYETQAESFKTFKEKSLEEKLEEANSLKDKGIITEEEYQNLRKNILNI